jgi:hypothetical protein
MILMPVSLSIDHPMPVVITSVFGFSYGTVAVQTQQTLLEAPVAFGCIRAVGDYHHLLDQSALALLPKNCVVQAFSAATGYGDFKELPIVEIMLGATGGTVSEYWIRQGWAVPDEAIYSTSLRSEQYIAALKAARSLRSGIWGEAHVTGSAMLSPELDRLTAPAVGHSKFISHAALTAVLIIAVILGWRQRYWRERIP